MKIPCSFVQSLNYLSDGTSGQHLMSKWWEQIIFHLVKRHHWPKKGHVVQLSPIADTRIHNRTPRNCVGFSLDIFLNFVNPPSNLFLKAETNFLLQHHNFFCIACMMILRKSSAALGLWGNHKNSQQKATFISKQAVTPCQCWGKREVWQPQQELDCTWT